MAMSRKHFKAVAEAFKTTEADTPQAMKEDLAEALVTVFKADNPRFDADRFLRAANLHELADALGAPS